MCKIRGKQITMIFQEPMTSLNPVFKVGSQIEEAVLLHHDFQNEHGKIISAQKKKDIAREKTIDLLEKVGIPDAASRAHDYPHQLSGGMRQRVMIAMALICQPDLLIADEPTTALDVTVQAQILDLLQHLQSEFKTAIILITHDFGIVAEFADEVAVMYAGQIVEQGTVEEIFAHPSHPYTRALMLSIPRLDLDEQDLYVIPGKVPNASRYPAGCRFAPRCSVAQSCCMKETPQLIMVSEGHLSRCFFAGEKSDA
jgi:peptide/nickel transport system ATP-binding protein